MWFVLRWLKAFALLAAIHNPTSFNYVKWVMTQSERPVSLMVIAGLLLLIGYIICLRATLRSIGGFGMLLVLALVGALLSVLYDFGALSPDNTGLNVWLGFFAFSLVLGVGISWCHVRRALSGQADMDDVYS